ncbi:MAG: leucine-rich repeat protein, partial [Clostridia bacterium]|nr:leucine-rich repeat protein [Clostridia bacterium]
MFWEVFAENGEQTLYFSIDKSKNDANTVLHAKDKSTGADIAFYKAGGSDVLPWGAYITKISKAVIGDGITEISGAAFAYSSIKSLEIPKSLVKLGYAALNRTLELDTINITGEEANPGVVNLKYITSIDNNVFGGENRIKKYSFNPDYAGAIGNEVFSKHNKMTEIEFPAGVTSLGINIFTGSTNIAYVRFLGKETTVTNDTFGGLDKYPRLVGYVGSAVETFAKSNGYTFINIETNEVVHEGTKPLAVIVAGEIEDKYVARFEKFDPTGATAHGHMTLSVVDTYWAYYQETKTLKIVSNSTSYNETGRLDCADDGK